MKMVFSVEEVVALAFGVALATFVLTRLSSGLSRPERKRLTAIDGVD
jgi:hypothetical protein